MKSGAIGRAVLVDHVSHKLPAVFSQSLKHLWKGWHLLPRSPTPNPLTVYIKEIDLLSDSTSLVIKPDVLVLPLSYLVDVTNQ